MFKVMRILQALIGIASVLIVSQVFAQTAVMKQFSQFSGGRRRTLLGSKQRAGLISHFLAIHRPVIIYNGTIERTLLNRNSLIIFIPSRPEETPQAGWFMGLQHRSSRRI
jgi:hypothetical protein